jgi:hypothetical protein
LTDDDSPPLLSQEQVPFRGTYRTALTAFDYTQEHVTMLPHELLSSSVMALLGKDRQKSGQTPVLFSAKPEFSRDLWRSVRERWIAAWYYLRNRYSEDELKHDAHLRKEIKELGETLLQEVRENAGDPSIVKLREAVVDLIDSLDDGINAAGN